MAIERQQRMHLPCSRTTQGGQTVSYSNSNSLQLTELSRWMGLHVGLYLTYVDFDGMYVIHFIVFRPGVNLAASTYTQMTLLLISLKKRQMQRKRPQ